MTTKARFFNSLFSLKKVIGVLFFLAMIACVCEADTLTNTPTCTFTMTFTATITTTPVVSYTWWVNAGGSSYVDSLGNTWSADTNFDTGTARSITTTVTNTNDSTLYQSERYGNPFTYTFDVPAGNYQVTLKFAETYWEASTDRVFNVSINGTQVLTNFDIFLDAGGALKADDKVFNNISPSNGQITIELGPASADNAQVCAIQIIPMSAVPTSTQTVISTFTNTITPTPNPNKTVVAGCANNMTIDGVMNESAWNSVSWNPISKLATGSNPDNVSGNFKTLWDSNYLYVGLNVNDSYLNATQVACANYNDSAVEIYLDMNNDWGAEPFPGSTGDFHLMISYNCLQFCENATVAMPPSGLQYAGKYNVSGYTMEVAIPWSLLGVAPVIGAGYEFDVQVDFNDGTLTRVGQLVWNGGANDWQSSVNFGIAQIGFCPSPTATITPIPPTLVESYHIFPNPVNPKLSQAHIEYYIANDSEISINIFTANGNLVKTILDKTLKTAGPHSEDTWNAINETGHDVLSGVYICVMEVNDKKTGTATKLVKKLAVLR